MSQQAYSRVLWDYLEDMPYMPSKADREALLQQARVDPANGKRVAIWDFFFRPRPEDVGKPLQARVSELRAREISGLARRANALDADVRIRIRVLSLILFGVAVMLVLHLLELTQHDTSLLLLALIVAFALAVLVDAYRRRSQAAQLRVQGRQAAQYYQTDYACLPPPTPSALTMPATEYDEVRRHIAAEIQIWQSRIASLQGQIPLVQRTAQLGQTVQVGQVVRPLQPDVPAAAAQAGDMHLAVSPAHIEAWLEEDFLELKLHAKQQLGLASAQSMLAGASEHWIFGPAELQAPERLPLFFQRDPDARKHLHARCLAPLADGWFIDFQGVYYVELLLITDRMLYTYGCYFDFITGRIVSERTAEQYLADVVDILTRQVCRDVVEMQTKVVFRQVIQPDSSRVLRDVEVREALTPTDDSPALAYWLTSGEEREVVYAGADYLELMRRQDGSMPALDLAYWARNPQDIADGAIAALRSHWRARNKRYG